MEVIYVDNQISGRIVNTVILEDIDIIGLRSLLGNHMALVPEVMLLPRGERYYTVMVTFGGTVPPHGVQKVKEIVIAEVFDPGTSLKTIIGFLSRENSI